MEINTTKESLNVNKTICEKKEIMNIQGDMIVPDSKPDILSTINTSGNVCIYKKEIMEGKLTGLHRVNLGDHVAFVDIFGC